MRLISRATGKITIVAILLAGGVASHRPAPPDRQPTPESRAQVLSLLGSTRPFKGRLLGMEYRPYEPKGEEIPEPHSLARVSNELRRRARKGEKNLLVDAELAQALGGDLDRAILFFDAAARQKGADAWIWSDLAVFYLAHGEAKDSPLLCLRALVAAENAINSDATLLEAKFNRALALQCLGIFWKAKSAWLDYLTLDKSSPWAEEARRHYHSLRRFPEEQLWSREKKRLTEAALLRQTDVLENTVSRFRLRTRTYGEEDLLGQWARLWQEKRFDEAGQALTVARELGRTIAGVAKDRMLADAVGVIDEVRLVNATRLPDLVEGQIGYYDGLLAYQAQDLPRAVSLFTLAQQRLLKVGSPLGYWSGVHLATSLFHQKRYREAQAILEEIQREVSAAHYPNLHGRVFWILGLISVVQSRYDWAQTRYLQALEMYRRSGDLESAASIHALIAEYFYFIGEQEEQWRHLRQALALLDRVPDSRRKHFILWNGTLAATRAGKPGIALYFQQELVRLAEASGDPLRVIQALANRAKLRFDAGMVEEGLQDLVEAKKHLEFDDNLLADTLLIESELRQNTEPSAAFAAANQAVESFQRTNYGAGLPRALLARARASIALNDPSRASADFTAAMNELNRQREDLLSADSRSQFFDEARNFFDEAATYHVTALRRPDLAYGFVEHSQARLLLDAFSNRAGSLRKDLQELPRVEEISHQLPSGVILIQFAVLEDRTFAWALWKEGARFEKSQMGETKLAEQISKFRAAILKNDQPVIDRLGEELYNALLSRLLKDVPQHNIQVFIPDKSLNHLPFAALRNPESGKYLIEERIIESAPSARIYLFSLEAASQRQRVSGPDSILLVADPEFDRNALPFLPQLPYSRKEVTRIKQVFGNAQILQGQAATKRALLSQSPRHSVLHLATHAVVNQRDSMFSYIALAPGEDSGMLFSHELYQQDLESVDLVFLAGCSTASGPVLRSEGMFSLARPLLAAGIPSVVGTLWKIEDKASSVFSVEFYHNLRDGMTASEALRASQIKMVMSEDGSLSKPSSWAAFSIIGAGRLKLN